MNSSLLREDAGYDYIYCHRSCQSGLHCQQNTDLRSHATFSTLVLFLFSCCFLISCNFCFRATSTFVLLLLLDTFIDTVSSDRSIPAAINFQATATPFRKDVAEAPRLKCLRWSMSSGKPFLRGSIRLPDIDWSADREDEPIGKNPSPKKRSSNRFYGTGQAHPSHSVWYVNSNARLGQPMLQCTIVVFPRGNA